MVKRSWCRSLTLSKNLKSRKFLLVSVSSIWHPCCHKELVVDCVLESLHLGQLHYLQNLEIIVGVRQWRHKRLGSAFFCHLFLFNLPSEWGIGTTSLIRYTEIGLVSGLNHFFLRKKITSELVKSNPKIINSILLHRLRVLIPDILGTESVALISFKNVKIWLHKDVNQFHWSCERD